MILNKLMVNIRNERKSAHIAFFPYRSLRMEVEDSSCRIPPRQVECIRVENYINMNINGMILEYNKIYCSLPASFFPRSHGESVVYDKDTESRRMLSCHRISALPHANNKYRRNSFPKNTYKFRWNSISLLNWIYAQVIKITIRTIFQTFFLSLYSVHNISIMECEVNVLTHSAGIGMASSPGDAPWDSRIGSATGQRRINPRSISLAPSIPWEDMLPWKGSIQTQECGLLHLWKLQQTQLQIN